MSRQSVQVTRCDLDIFCNYRVFTQNAAITVHTVGQSVPGNSVLEFPTVGVEGGGAVPRAVVIQVQYHTGSRTMRRVSCRICARAPRVRAVVMRNESTNENENEIIMNEWTGCDQSRILHDQIGKQ